MWSSMVGGLRQNIEGLKKHFASKAAILMYHRVVDMKVDPWLLCVSPQHFAEHLEILKKHAHPISLKQLVQAHEKGDIPDRAVAVTFDDGYADIFHNAKPILEQYNIPATAFVVSDAIGQKREFWWDELERIFLEPGTLPEILELKIGNEAFRWELGTSAKYSEEDYQRYGGWIMNWQEFPTFRHSLYCALSQLLQPLTTDAIHQAMDDLLVWSGKQAIPFSRNRALSQQELDLLGKGDLIAIGAHTRTHPFLSMLSKNRQQDEITRNKTTLEELLGKPVHLFAYPYGNYSMQTRTIVQEADFAGACIIDEKCVWHGSDRYLLPRVTIRDSSGDEFLARLNQILR